ncbi:MAG TPA: aminotransferase class V-fold PLP-dependent enzyme [Vicinamibacterales bacterium]|nr:aminotransferase class V-fold PLP-dependent enzyme [Vicinamibacterales bacterium]
MTLTRGRHFLQIPGPTNVPDRVLRALAQPTIDHRSQAFAALTREALDGVRRLFKTSAHAVIYPASGSGGWEAAFVNTLSPGDRVLIPETGHFSAQWREVALRLGLDAHVIPGDWRHGADLTAIEERLLADRERRIKAVAVVHNETSTGTTSRIADVRRRLDEANHPALLLVDTVSSLACMDYRHDEWGVDVSIAASQKGLMLPPGLGLLAISDKALAAGASAGMPRSYWDWRPMIADNRGGFFPTTPATNMLFALVEAIRMLEEEGLPNVFARHQRFAEATRRAVRAWGLDLVCLDRQAYSSSVTAVVMPNGHNADHFRKATLDAFDMSLGAGLGKLKGTTFRIGHLGDFNDLMLAGTLSGVEMGLALADVPFTRGGITAALEYLAPSVASPAVQSKI